MSKLISTSFDPKSVLLTGSSGFIGSAVNQLLEYKCVISVRKLDSNCINLSKQLIKDTSDLNMSNDVFSNIKYVIHLAGLAHSNLSLSSDYKSVNVDLALNLARNAASAGVKRFVFVSSIGVNGTSTQKNAFCGHDTANPHNAYAQSKYDAEVGLKTIADETGLEVVIVRPTLVYGPSAPGNFGLLTKLVRKLPLLPFGRVNNMRDFIAVQNLADLLVTCANHPDAAGHTFLASDGETVSIKEFTNAIAKGLNKKLIQLPVPVSLMKFVAGLVRKSAMAEQLLGNLQVDSSNAQDVLGWIPPYTMEQAMASLSENKK
ncbi:NAD-dependent epimerase/dehydratase family protein [Shewanella sp. BF02_Schw]|uniref:NAD-dependent epimerase/dehydratase family protein n=1 Tax=Shewanella sp. BF02_Schw TaxID=394908 RepID=UPI001785A4F5|nr:NAD-dependent epimerase/dehydratase family protein [Shewanella sp. BF02_Schw]